MQNGIDYYMPTEARNFPATNAIQLLDELRRAEVSHMISVPDTLQRRLISIVSERDEIELLMACTEDEAMGIHLGLYLSNHQPIVSIQNAGLYACINSIKALSLDAQVPTVMLVGQYGQDTTISIEENKRRSVRNLVPTLATWGVNYQFMCDLREPGQLSAEIFAARKQRATLAVIIEKELL